MSFLNALPGAVAEGMIWGLMAIGVYLSYKILDIADLTVDGSICTGACVCAVLLGKGLPVWTSVVIAFGAGALAGIVTGLLHTALGIPSILAGILTLFLTYFTYTNILSPIIYDFGLFTPVSFQSRFIPFALFYIVSGALIGMVGSVYPVKKYLNV